MSLVGIFNLGDGSKDILGGCQTPAGRITGRRTAMNLLRSVSSESNIKFVNSDCSEARGFKRSLR